MTAEIVNLNSRRHCPPRMPKPVTTAIIWTGENEQFRLQVRYQGGLPRVWLNQHRRHANGKTEYRNLATFPAAALNGLEQGFRRAAKLAVEA